IAFRQIAGDGLYQSRYGFPAGSEILPFVTINEHHMRSMMGVIERLTEGHGSKLFIYKTIPNFASFENFPKPDGHMLEQDWLRVGKGKIERYNFLEELGVK